MDGEGPMVGPTKPAASLMLPKGQLYMEPIILRENGNIINEFNELIAAHQITVTHIKRKLTILLKVSCMWNLSYLFYYFQYMRSSKTKITARKATVSHVY